MTTLSALNLPRITAADTLSGGFDDGFWSSVPAGTLAYAMGTPPVHRPLTRFKMAWDGPLICLIFEVQDRYVCARARKYQDPVYTDSCVEFFFTPNDDLMTGYFNLEINCGGIALFEFHPGGGKSMVPMPRKAFDRITIRPSLPPRIDPEIETPLTWTLEYRFPVDILRPYTPVTRPEKGAWWRGNLYKCADKSSHPHWLTWAPVHAPRPCFHLPQWFGRLIFD